MELQPLFPTPSPTSPLLEFADKYLHDRNVMGRESVIHEAAPLQTLEFALSLISMIFLSRAHLDGITSRSKVRITSPYCSPSHSARKRSTNSTMYRWRSSASWRAVGVCMRSLSQKSFS